MPRECIQFNKNLQLDAVIFTDDLALTSSSEYGLKTFYSQAANCFK
jgi:hypothetical protein